MQGIGPTKVLYIRLLYSIRINYVESITEGKLGKSHQLRQVIGLLLLLPSRNKTAVGIRIQ